MSVSVHIGYIGLLPQGVGKGEDFAAIISPPAKESSGSLGLGFESWGCAEGDKEA